MSTQTPLVRVAERAGGARGSQDRTFLLPNAVIVLDGASQPDASGRDGAWIAHHLGSAIASRLTGKPYDDLAAVVYSAIDEVASRWSLQPGAGPSTTVSIVCWNANHVDVFVLGDTRVIIETTDGSIHQVRDDRLASLAGREQFELKRRNGGFATDYVDEWRAWIAVQLRARNRPGGYWIAEATPEAAQHAMREQWPRSHVARVVIATDGVTDGVDRYGLLTDWKAAMHLAAVDPRALVDLVHHTEEQDADGHRWPRYKRHDDKSAVVISFDGAGPESQS
jgi:hypothetical protein